MQPSLFSSLTIVALLFCLYSATRTTETVYPFPQSSLIRFGSPMMFLFFIDLWQRKHMTTAATISATSSAVRIRSRIQPIVFHPGFTTFVALFAVLVAFSPPSLENSQKKVDETWKRSCEKIEQCYTKHLRVLPPRVFEENGLRYTVHYEEPGKGYRALPTTRLFSDVSHFTSLAILLSHSANATVQKLVNVLPNDTYWARVGVSCICSVIGLGFVFNLLLLAGSFAILVLQEILYLVPRRLAPNIFDALRQEVGPGFVPLDLKSGFKIDSSSSSSFVVKAELEQSVQNNKAKEKHQPRRVWERYRLWNAFWPEKACQCVIYDEAPARKEMEEEEHQMWQGLESLLPPIWNVKCWQEKEECCQASNCDGAIIEITIQFKRQVKNPQKNQRRLAFFLFCKKCKDARLRKCVSGSSRFPDNFDAEKHLTFEKKKQQQEEKEDQQNNKNQKVEEEEEGDTNWVTAAASS